MAKSSPMGDWITANLESVVEWYGTELVTLAECAGRLGCSHSHLCQILSDNPELFARARIARADTLHNVAMGAIMERPMEYIDAEGNKRVDNGDVAFKRFQAQEAGRLAGIMDRRYGEGDKRVQVGVTIEGGGVTALLAACSAPAALPQGRTIEHDSDESTAC